MAAERVRLAVAGTGYWGINLVRAFSRLAGCELVAVCDPDERARARAAALAPRARRGQARVRREAARAHERRRESDGGGGPGGEPHAHGRSLDAVSPRVPS